MKLLLDTHTLIWWTLTPERLSERVANLLAQEDNDLLLSVASVWEMQIKIQSGKLNLDLPRRELISTQQQTNNLQLLPIEVEDVWVLESLPAVHRDPFDRIIIAQAIGQQLPIISVDGVFDGYPVQRLW
ncbi:MAG: type II toxin-antitoxin system VapC family toxin [Oscillatoriaceae cyanobacterium]